MSYYKSVKFVPSRYKTICICNNFVENKDFFESSRAQLHENNCVHNLKTWQMPFGSKEIMRYVDDGLYVSNNKNTNVDLSLIHIFTNGKKPK